MASLDAVFQAFCSPGSSHRSVEYLSNAAAAVEWDSKRAVPGEAPTEVLDYMQRLQALAPGSELPNEPLGKARAFGARMQVGEQKSSLVDLCGNLVQASGGELQGSIVFLSGNSPVPDYCRRAEGWWCLRDADGRF